MCVYQVSSQMASIKSGKLLFDKIQLFQSSVCHHKYDPITSSLELSETGLYWFHLSIGVPAYTKANCTINGLSNTIGIIKDNTAYTDDQVTVDGLSWVSKGIKLSVFTSYNLFNSNSSVGETAWIWLRLDTVMQQVVAFYVVKTSAEETLSDGLQLTYDQVIINEGNGWNQSFNMFVAPVSGNYFVSFGIASPSKTSSCLKLVKNPSTTNIVSVKISCIKETSAHNGVEIARAAIMIYLNVNDSLASFVVTNSVFYNGNGTSGYTYLQSFLYNPSNGSKIAWSVLRKMTDFFGPVDPMQFDFVQVNNGNPWKTSSYNVIIPKMGLYLVDLSTNLCGFYGSFNENVQVMLNNSSIIESKLNTTVLGDCITRSRAVMIQLYAGDVLRVRVPTNRSYYYSSNNGHHAFTGFLLYNTN